MTHGKRAVSNSCSHLVENITTSNCVSFLSSLSLSLEEVVEVGIKRSLICPQRLQKAFLMLKV